MKGIPFLEIARSGPERVAKLGVKRVLKPTKPRKLLTSYDIVDQAASSTARILSSVRSIPYLDNTSPTKTTLTMNNSHCGIKGEILLLQPLWYAVKAAIMLLHTLAVHSQIVSNVLNTIIIKDHLPYYFSILFCGRVFYTETIHLGKQMWLYRVICPLIQPYETQGEGQALKTVRCHKDFIALRQQLALVFVCR